MKSYYNRKKRKRLRQARDAERKRRRRVAKNALHAGEDYDNLDNRYLLKNWGIRPNKVVGSRKQIDK